MKIAICTPVHGDVKASFYQSAMNMLAFSGRQLSDAKLETYIERGSYIGHNREKLAECALANGCDYVLWLDADHEFPHQTLVRLLSHDKDIVAANYPRRSNSALLQPVASRNSVPVWSGRNSGSGEELEAVDFTGMGLCLIRRAVFEHIERPWFEDYRTGEDVEFFAKARAAGFDVWIDHPLSKRVGHIAERVLTFR